MSRSEMRQLERASAPRQQFRNLQAYLLDALGRTIVSGEVPPGEALPPEPELAKQFAISKTIVREALRGLAAKGLVEARPRLGTRVQDPERWHILDPDVLSWLLDLGREGDLLGEFDEFRRAVEPMAARLAAARGTTELRAELRAALDAMRENVEDPASYFQADIAFHIALLTATNNRILRGLRDTLRSALAVRHSQAINILRDMHESLPYHEKVAQAIQDRDATAAGDAMDALLELSTRDDRRLRRRRGTSRRQG